MCIKQNVHKNRHSCNELHGFLMIDEEELSIYIKQIFNVPSQKKKKGKESNHLRCAAISFHLFCYICCTGAFQSSARLIRCRIAGNKIFIYSVVYTMLLNKIIDSHRTGRRVKVV